MFILVRVRKFFHMYVCLINLIFIWNVWKLDVDVFACRTRHSRSKLGELAALVDDFRLLVQIKLI